MVRYMISGIYKLSFKNIKEVYIGYASDISNRYSKHCSLLKLNKHHNYKLSRNFIKYGLPILEILEITDIKDMPLKEIYYIDKYNSYNKGLNLTVGGDSVGFGEKHPNAKGLDIQYKLIVTLLALTNKTAKEISKEVGLPISIVQSISSLDTHLYLKDIMPIEFMIINSKKGIRISGKSCAKDRGIVYPKIFNLNLPIELRIPQEISNIREFARINNLDQAALGRLLNYKAKSHKGWQRYEPS